MKLRRYSSRVQYIQGDVSKIEDCQRIVKETVKLFGGVSALVTAAGYYEEELLADVTEAAFDEMFGTNEKVRFSCAKRHCPICALQRAVS